MQNKEELVSAIIEFVKVDNDIKTMTAELGVLRKKKKELTKDLSSTMREHSIDQFEIQGGSIIYDRRQVKRTLTQRLLGELVSKFFHNDPETAAKFCAYLDENRGETVRENIVRKSNNNSNKTKFAAVDTNANANAEKSSPRRLTPQQLLLAVDRAQNEAAVHGGWENEN